MGGGGVISISILLNTDMHYYHNEHMSNTLINLAHAHESDFHDSLDCNLIPLTSMWGQFISFGLLWSLFPKTKSECTLGVKDMGGGFRDFGVTPGEGVLHLWLNVSCSCCS